MKKRIISLILVVATLLLTLAGCAYSYAKDDMTKYATFDEGAFNTALKNLVITDGTFGTNEAERQLKVLDAIATAFLGKTTDKSYAGKLQNSDAVYYCYMAKDEDGNIFFVDKMDETKAVKLQLGLSTNKDLDKTINDELLKVENVEKYIYSTSAANKVNDGDVVSVSYFVSWTENGEAKSDVVWNEYHEVNAATDKFSENIIGATVGVELPNQFSVTKEDVTKTYSNVKVESIAKDNTTPKVQDGDVVFVTYTISFPAKDWQVDGKYNLPEDYTKNIKYDIDSEGNYKATVTNEIKTVKGYTDEDYKTEGENAKPVLKEESKNFLAELVGKDVGTTLSTITVKETIGDKTVEVKYTSTKVNWIVTSNNDPILVEYTEEALKEDNSNKKEATNNWGEKVTLNGKKLTYQIFPIYYIDVLDVAAAVDTTVCQHVDLITKTPDKKCDKCDANMETVADTDECQHEDLVTKVSDKKCDNCDVFTTVAIAEFILENFYSVLDDTKTADHDHTEEAHEHETVYVFDSLNKDDAGKEFKNGDKTLATLVSELVSLYTTHADKDKALTEALKALNTAQQNLAKTTYEPSTAEYAALKTKLENAETAYISAKTAEQTEKAKINGKIDEIVACTKDGAKVDSLLATDYQTYQYDTLETAYKKDINTKLATEIITYLKKNITYKSNLPKKAVKNAYDAIMNEYKNDFYENDYTSGSSTTSTSGEKNYKHYNGDFNAYLIDKVTSNKGNMTDVKAKIQEEAENTVKEIIMIYVFADAVEAKWSDADVMLSKADKKQIKQELEETALLYKQFNLTFEYNIDDHYNAGQFDKVMNYLLELGEEKENDNFVYYKNIAYKTEAADK